MRPCHFKNLRRVVAFEGLVGQCLAFGHTKLADGMFHPCDLSSGDAELIQSEPDHEGRELQTGCHFTANADPYAGPS